ETLFSKRKIQVGPILTQQGSFVRSGSADNVTSFINKYIVPGTTIMPGRWKASNSLQSLRIKHSIYTHLKHSSCMANYKRKERGSIWRRPLLLIYMYINSRVL
ncbi:hypothetical protein J437_LFUL010167, partial [Ladona fulva]